MDPSRTPVSGSWAPLYNVVEVTDDGTRKGVPSQTADGETPPASVLPCVVPWTPQGYKAVLVAEERTPLQPDPPRPMRRRRDLEESLQRPPRKRFPAALWIPPVTIVAVFASLMGFVMLARVATGDFAARRVPLGAPPIRAPRLPQVEVQIVHEVALPAGLAAAEKVAAPVKAADARVEEKIAAPEKVGPVVLARLGAKEAIGNLEMPVGPECKVCRPEKAEERPTFGTAVGFVRNPQEAARIAAAEHKLTFLLHVSGDFEDSGFT